VLTRIFQYFFQLRAGQFRLIRSEQYAREDQVKLQTGEVILALAGQGPGCFNFLLRITINLTACRKQGQGNQYLPGGTVAANIDWYKAHLPGFRLYHAMWADRSQDTFWSPDGTKGVNITGTPKSDQVFPVMYLQMKSGLTEHERAAFSPSNPTCK
jgi:hypothetical protein